MCSSYCLFVLPTVCFAFLRCIYRLLLSLFSSFDITGTSYAKVLYLSMRLFLTDPYGCTFEKKKKKKKVSRMLANKHVLLLTFCRINRMMLVNENECL